MPYLDVPVRVASALPAPGQYNPPQEASSRAPKMAPSEYSGSALEVVIRRARLTPGPGTLSCCACVCVFVSVCTGLTQLTTRLDPTPANSCREHVSMLLIVFVCCNQQQLCVCECV